MTSRQIESLIKRVVREEVRAEIKRLNLSAAPVRKRKPCGTGDSMPECWGSTIYGPEGCYCR